MSLEELKLEIVLSPSPCVDNVLIRCLAVRWFVVTLRLVKLYNTLSISSASRHIKYVIQL